MKKKNIIASLILIILLAGLLIIFWAIKNDKLITKEKKYSFDEYELIANQGDLIKFQNEVDSKIFDDINLEDYSLENPYVIVDPYEVSPLTGIVAFKTTEKTSIEITIESKNSGKDLVYSTKEATEHYIPLYGLYADHVNQVTLKTQKGNSSTISVPVDTENKHTHLYFPDIFLKNNKLSEEDNDFFFTSTPLGNQVIAYDQTGEVRWYLSKQIFKDMTRLSNGNFLLASPESYENNSLGLLEIDLLGKIYNSYDLSEPYYFNFIELPNKNILYSTESNKLIELDLTDGSIVNTYDLYKMMSEIDSKFMTTIKDKFNDINSLYYDKETDTIMVGLHHYSTLIGIDKNKKIEWIFANPEYYSGSFSKYLLKPTNENFVYPMGNYNAKLENGMLTLLNNDWDITKTYSCKAAESSSSNVKDYKVDFKSKTITEEYSFGEGYFSFTFGDYTFKNNERLIMFGREFPDGFREPMDVCNMYEEGDFFADVIVLNENNEETFKMTIANSLNYINKMPIYDQSFKVEKTTAKVHLAEQPHDDYEEVKYDEKYEKSQLSNIPLEFNGNKLKVLLYKENYKIILMDEYGKGLVYNAIEDTIKVKKGIGKALVFLEFDDEIINTGYYVEL